MLPIHTIIFHRAIRRRILHKILAIAIVTFWVAAWSPHYVRTTLASDFAVEALLVEADDEQSPQQREGRADRRAPRVFRDRVTPHWFANNTRFWYRNDLREGAREFIVVDAHQGTRGPAFDHVAVAQAIGEGLDPARLPVDALAYSDDGKQITLVGGSKSWIWDTGDLQLRETTATESTASPVNRLDPLSEPLPSTRTGAETEIVFDNQLAFSISVFWIDSDGKRQPYGSIAAGTRKEQHTFAGHRWLVTGDQGIILGFFEARDTPSVAIIDGKRAEVRPVPRRRTRAREDQNAGGQSPDGKWVAQVKDHNVYLKATDSEQEISLSTDGSDALAYSQLSWSPDSRTLVAFRVEPGERKEVHLVQSSPEGGGRARLQSRPYALPGDKFSSYELNVFDVATSRQIKPSVDRFEHERSRPRLRWNHDASCFTYEQTDRGHQRFRLIEVETATSTIRNLIDEKSETFIWTAHTESQDFATVNWLEQSDELVVVSERSGWRHLFLMDAIEGAIKNPITSGQWIVRGIERIDETLRQICFRASGCFPGQDPYLIHFGRVNFDGSGLVWLTDGDGQHQVQFSPDNLYLIDTFSRVDQAPITQLRRAEDGKFVCALETAEIDLLQASGWSAPEVFSAKGRDGQTDIWGIIRRPRDFDPAKQYPVIEDIYAGPHSSFVPKSFSSSSRFESLTDLGFIVVKIDGMGTANRSKAFHDVCWHDLKDAGFEDRILWMRAAAEKYPQLDLSRVGVYGTSAGGQNAAGAVLFHPEFYKVAVAASGCHDNRMDKASWNEQWMGYPVGPQYSESSNIDNAYRLHGKLLLIVGEMDANVPPESTLRFADALIRADKDFDLLVVPNAGHGMGGAYGARRMRDFFVRHLLKEEPPNRNVPSVSNARTVQTATVSTQTVETLVPSNPGVAAPPESFFGLVRERDREVARRFYKKFLDINGLPVVAAEIVADDALLRTQEIVSHMLAGRPDIHRSMRDNGMYLIIIGKDQVYTDMPEYRQHPNPAYQNERVRGTGGKPTSFGEENLLSLPLDRYDDESIAVHEFCHTIDSALRAIDPTWQERRGAVFASVRKMGLYENAYAGSNAGEYWAEICQAYFDCNRVNNWNHGPIGNREQLKIHDPQGYELVRSTFRLQPEQDWRYSYVRPLPNIQRPPEKFQFDPYYTKFTWAREFTVLGRQASDQALLKANDSIRKLFAYRHDILKALIADGVRLVVLSRDERLADLPELREAASQNRFDLLARTLSYSPDKKLLVVGEELVLANPQAAGHSGDALIRLLAESILQVAAARPVDPAWDSRPRNVWQQYELRLQRIDLRFAEQLQELHTQAIAAGKWQGNPASHDRLAYWVTGVLAYFDAAGQTTAPHDASHPIRTREQLEVYDPALFALVQKTMAYEHHVDWRFFPAHAEIALDTQVKIGSPNVDAL